jgi:hypothetical protein
MALEEGDAGTLAFWEGVELAIRRLRNPRPVSGAEWSRMRVTAAKAWIEAGTRDYTVRKKHDMRTKRKA